MVFLDIAKAFDTVGHNHIKQTLESLPIPPTLRSLVFSLISGNNVTVEVNKKSSKPINMLRGVTQETPLSPTIFNLCQDFVLKQISDPGVASIHGFLLNGNLDNISVIGFADDTTIIAKDLESATVLVDMARDSFSSVGMQINPSKSHAIDIVNENLIPKAITLSDSSVIPSLGDTNRIKYFGINFKDEIIFDQKESLISLERDFRNLVTSPLLIGDQKLNILNQYVYPKLIYPLQTTPVDLLHQSFLERVDMLIRQGVREICGLSADMYSTAAVKSVVWVCYELFGKLLYSTWQSHRSYLE